MLLTERQSNQISSHQHCITINPNFIHSKYWFWPFLLKMTKQLIISSGWGYCSLEQLLPSIHKILGAMPTITNKNKHTNNLKWPRHPVSALSPLLCCSKYEGSFSSLAFQRSPCLTPEYHHPHFYIGIMMKTPLPGATDAVLRVDKQQPSSLLCLRGWHSHW